MSDGECGVEGESAFGQRVLQINHYFSILLFAQCEAGFVSFRYFDLVIGSHYFELAGFVIVVGLAGIGLDVEID